MARKKRISGITIELEGDATPLKRALSEVDKAAVKSESELGKINRALKFDEGNQTLLAQKFEVLEETIQQTSTRLDALRSAKIEVDREFAAGNIDASSYREFIRQIETTESRLNSFREQAADVRARIEVQADTSQLDRVRASLRQLGQDARQAGQEIGQGIAAGAAAGTAALGGLALAGGETARDLARLNAVTSNLGFDNSEGQIDRILVNTAALNGDINATVEAINNLANTDLNQSQLESTLESLSGAAIQFSETLSLEGLADGLQETLAIGEGAGSFIEYLERSGIVLDTFNEGLAVAKSQGTELDYVLGVLNTTSGQEFLDTYRENNKELYEFQKAQAETEIAISKLTVALAPLLTVLAQVATAFANFVAENPLVSQVLFTLLGVITAVSAAIAVLTPIITAVTTVATSLGVTIGALLTPIGYVIAGIGALIAIVTVLRGAWEPLGEFFTTLWDGIVNAFTGAWDVIKNLFNGAINIFRKPINSIIDLVNNFIEGLNKIKIPDFIPVVGGKGFNIPEIPKFARGTDYFRGGLALVGEEGPELVNLPRGSAVNTASETNDLLGGGININVSSLVVREEADVKKVARELYVMWQKETRGRG